VSEITSENFVKKILNYTENNDICLGGVFFIAAHCRGPLSDNIEDNIQAMLTSWSAVRTNNFTYFSYWKNDFRDLKCPAYSYICAGMFGTLKPGFRSLATCSDCCRWTLNRKNSCGIARFPCDSTAFLFVFELRARTRQTDDRRTRKMRNAAYTIGASKSVNIILINLWNLVAYFYWTTRHTYA